MTSQEPPSGGEHAPVNIEEEMRGSYLAYAMSVIIGRALPDVRDGLKPVHRRVLYTMYEQRNLHNSAYKKSARIVGDVLGKYHPHGDQAVYDTMVRMAQDFSMRYPLVDGQGNFGSIDGDPPAAMRYTEVRMTRLAEEMLQDIEKETVDWQENYDGSEQEPQVLPAGFPNLLVNGSGGIAVGMATNMPPHNLGETIDATIALIDDPAISVEELERYMPGPDFPSGGTIHGRQGIRQAYRTGRGSIRVRGRTEIEHDQRGDERAIVVRELPYQVNKAKLLERIAELVREEKIEGIRDLRDESDRNGMRIYIELKKDVMAPLVLNKLYAATPLQTTFGVNNLAIVGGQPRMLTLKETLVHFVNHRRDVVTRRSRYELRKAEERAHILEGLLVALDRIDEIVDLIKRSPSPSDAREGLQTEFGLSRAQAQAILDMRLQRLTAMEADKIKEEYRELQETIRRLKEILASDSELLGVIRGELQAIRDRFDDARRTEIVDDQGNIGMEDLIADEEMVVTVTGTGYIKRTPLSEYRTQRRGGRGRSGMQTKKAADEVSHLFVASAHTTLLLFSDRGRAYRLKAWELPEGGTRSSGKAIRNLIPTDEGERIQSIVSVEGLDRDDASLVFATAKGIVKRTPLNHFRNVRNAGIRALRLDEDDDLVGVRLAEADQRVMLATAHGRCILFAPEDIRATSRYAGGVRGIRLRAGDRVVAMELTRALRGEGLEAEEEDEEATEELAEEEAGERTVVLITENGYGKRTPLDRFRFQQRGGVGLRALPYTKRNGELVDMCQVDPEDDLMVLTDGGTVIRIPVSDVRVYSRQARGVRLISLSEGERVASVRPVPRSDRAEGEGEQAEAEESASGSADAEAEEDGSTS